MGTQRRPGPTPQVQPDIGGTVPVNRFTKIYGGHCQKVGRCDTAAGGPKMWTGSNDLEPLVGAWTRPYLISIG